MIASAPTVVSSRLVMRLKVAPRFEKLSVLDPRMMAFSMFWACFSSHTGSIERSSAKALMVVRPAIISPIRLSRLCVDWRSWPLASPMMLAERHAMNMKTGSITSSTQATGAAMTKINTKNKMANGRSATNRAVEPDKVLRTTSTSRNRAVQYAEGWLSRFCRGRRINLRNSRRPSSTSTRSATVCRMRARD